jgi:hypothetical protein
MSQMITAFESFKNDVIQSAINNGTMEDLNKVNNIFSRANSFIREHNAVSAGAALESLGEVHNFVNTLKLGEDITVSSIESLVDACDVPRESRTSTIMHIARLMSTGTPSAAEFFAPTRRESNLIPTVQLTGVNAFANINKDALALESFGQDMDRLSVDNRLNISISLLRAHKSLIERVLPRVTSETNIITTKIPDPEVYNLAASQNPSSSIRNNPNTRYKFVTLYRNPEPVSTEPQAVIPNTADDTSTPSALVETSGGTGYYRSGQTVNLFDLSLNAALPGYTSVDFTDLISEGGSVSTLLIQVSQTISSVTTTEYYNVSTEFRATARFVQMNNTQLDSGDRAANIKIVTSLQSTSTMINGSATSIFSTFTANDKANLTINFNAVLNLKNGNLDGSGSVSAVAASTTSTAPTSGQISAVAGMTFTVYGYKCDLKFSEENLRKMNIAVRLGSRQQTFEIPVGRMYAVDFSLAQQTPEDVLNVISNVMSLGNDYRSLNVITSKMAEVNAQMVYATANPDVDWSNQVAMDFAAGTVCLPYIYIGAIDFTDVIVLRESERLAESHARMRSFILGIVALINANSQYTYNLEPGEKIVYKLITSNIIREILFGIMDYHNVYNDKVANKDAKSDYSMDLPNGTRLDIVGTNFEQYNDTIIMYPIREADPEHVTSFATLQDSGTFVAQYTPVNNGAANKRVISNSREIPYVTNPIGAQLSVTGVDLYLDFLSPINLSSDPS